MRKTVLSVLATSMMLLSPMVFGGDKPAEQTRSTPLAPSAGRKFSDLTPEEQAKLRQKWQGTSGETKAKVTDKLRERSTSRSTLAQVRKQAALAEMTRLQEQYKTGVDELQAIRQIATKENAKETITALNALIAKHEARYNQQLQVVQQRLKLLAAEQAGSQGQAQPGQPPKPPEPAPKTEPPKPQDAVKQQR